ncbi:SMC family ATPase [Microbacterium sp.]|uniref:SMC family ATPase n=1 Tax=Microbacterium sp. TaxID=51671 RepID=UPI002812446E|nr:SMC family ATPase [Microbacterium sp.]
MQLHRLEVEGFGPFRAKQVVDFDAFADDGIFLIAGRTGAGKSSILDAVCFGLYGGVPRYDGGEKRLRSDHCEPDDPTSVSVEFSTVAGRFRVTRSPAYERPAKRGGGMTTQAPSAVLEELTDAGWVGRAARVVDVANELEEILQLSQEQFLQVILLAQNRFADFLLADSKERQALLRRLFGTGRFADHQARFDERRRVAEQELSGRRAGVDARLEQAEQIVTDAELWGDDGATDPTATTQDRLGALRRAITRAEYQVERFTAEREVAERRHAAADTALTDARERAHAQRERDRSRAALAALDAEADDIADAVARRDRARAAEGLHGLIAAAKRAAAALADAERAEADAVRAAARIPELATLLAADGSWVPELVEGPDVASTGSATQDGRAPDPGRAPEPLRAWASERTRESGAWQRAAELEQQARARDAEIAAAKEAVDTASAELEAIDAERAELPARRAEITARRDEARRTGDRADDLARAVDDARARLAGTTEAQRLHAQREDAIRVESEASTAHAAAQNTLADLRRRRLDGFAGELASALVPGEPCAVCGATEHPAPAEHADPVSADDIAAAETARDAAAETERAATRRVATLTAEHAAAMERAGGRTVEQADTELATATEAHTAALAAAHRAQELDAQLRDAEQRAQELEQHRADVSEMLAALRTALSLAEQRAADADKLIAAARGHHPTVAARLGEAKEQIATAEGAADAIDDRIARATAAAEAIAERDAAIADSPFPDAGAAEAALLPSSEIAALDARITQHTVQREKEKEILLALELRVLPEDPIDLAPFEQAAADARQAWMQAVDGDSRARGVQQNLTALVDAAASEHAASAAQAEEYEVLRGLADTLAGRSGNTHKMNLETFVLAAELEEIVDAANLRLHDMSDGRYQLRHSDALAARGAASGLGIVVFDAFTGHTRPAKSLSGGETFLSSLALALGLAEVVTARAGGIRLDTLFIDEGFGSLDADTLETAMRTLDELRQGGRTVGVISHVEAMQEQIPAQLTVRALPDGPSVIDAR